jgi:hypothetical protein
MIIVISTGSQCQECIVFGWGGFFLEFEDSSEYKYVEIDASSVWSITKPEKNILFLPPNDRNYGDYAIITAKNKNYPKNLYSSFQLKLFIEDADLFSFEFEHKYDFDQNNNDGGIIEISHDMGLSWQNIIFDTTIIENIKHIQGFYTKFDTIGSHPDKVGFTGQQEEMKYAGFYFWRDERFLYDTLLLRFSIISDSIDSNDEGWMVDRIHFGGALVNIKDHFWDNQEFSIIPNPSNDIITVHSRNGLEIQSIELISSTGRIMKTVKNCSTLILNNISPGLYLVKINGTHIKKLLIE